MLEPSPHLDSYLCIFTQEKANGLWANSGGPCMPWSLDNGVSAKWRKRRLCVTAPIPSFDHPPHVVTFPATFWWQWMSYKDFMCWRKSNVGACSCRNHPANPSQWARSQCNYQVKHDYCSFPGYKCLSSMLKAFHVFMCANEKRVENMHKSTGEFKRLKCCW